MASRNVYILGGVADFSPPRLWTDVSSGGEQALQEALEQGRMEPLYGTSLLFACLEGLARRCMELGIGLERVGSIELGLAYPRELAGLDEEAVVEDMRRRMSTSVVLSQLRRNVTLRFRPTVSASSSGMVPLNDGVASILGEGNDVCLVAAAGNVKGTRPGRARLSPTQSSEILANLISPLERRLTGATMLKVAAALLARACQHDLDLMPAIAKHIREVRLSVHRLALSGESAVHISTHPDGYPDRTVWSPMRLMGIAPQSMGYAGVILGAGATLSRDTDRAPSAAVRILGVGAGIDTTAIRKRPDPLASRAMLAAMDRAEAQAQIEDPRRLWLFEAHNAFPGVFLAEVDRILRWRGEAGTVAEALLEDRAGALDQPLLISPAGGALAGHPITATTVRLVLETFKLLRKGHPTRPELSEGVTFGAVSAVGGPHSFDGFFLLGAGPERELEERTPKLEPFDHDALDQEIRVGLAEEEAEESVAEPGPLGIAAITRSEPNRDGHRDYFGLARDATGRHVPFTASTERFEELLVCRYLGTPIRVDEKLRLTMVGPEAW